MTSEERADNASHSPTTDPGAAAALLDALPCDSARLPEAVSALVMDRQFAAGLRVAVAPDSAGDPECRTIRRILGRLRALDPAPLDVPRPPERRLIGVCRDHALLACAALRHHGVPARLRAGLASYFRAGHHEDHVVCEYHAGDRWRLADSELTGPVRDHFGIAFDPADVPRDAFLVGGDAWQRLRRGALDPARCGVSFIGIAGAWFVAGSVVRDVAALDKREMLLWDYWGLVRDFGRGTVVPAHAAERLDAVAARPGRSPRGRRCATPATTATTCACRPRS